MFTLGLKSLECCRTQVISSVRTGQAGAEACECDRLGWMKPGRGPFRAAKRGRFCIGSVSEAGRVLEERGGPGADEKGRRVEVGAAGRGFGRPHPQQATSCKPQATTMQGVRIKLERFSSGGVWQGGQGDNEKKSRPIKNGVGGLASTCSLAWHRRNQKEGQGRWNSRWLANWDRDWLPRYDDVASCSKA